jgi:coenzyme F420-reducing hydrogenase delta subunit
MSGSETVTHLCLAVKGLNDWAHSLVVTLVTSSGSIDTLTVVSATVRPTGALGVLLALVVTVADCTHQAGSRSQKVKVNVTN